MRQWDGQIQKSALSIEKNMIKIPQGEYAIICQNMQFIRIYMSKYADKICKYMSKYGLCMHNVQNMQNYA